MTVKIPMMTPLPDPDIVDYKATPAWSNFYFGIGCRKYSDRNHNKIASALRKCNAVWLRGEHMIEFASEEQAVLWVLRWSGS